MTDSLLADGFVGLLADSTVKATILLVVAVLVLKTSRRASAAIRHRVWAMTLCGLTVTPALAWLAPGWTFSVLPAPTPYTRETPSEIAEPPSVPPVFRPAPVIAPSIASPIVLERPIPSVLSREAEAVSRSVVARPQSPWTWTDMVIATWVFGFVSTATPPLLGLIANERRRRFASRLTSEDWSMLLGRLRRTLAIRREVELRWSDESMIPSTWGVLRPVVLLPGEAQAWPESTRGMVLAHELAHVQRYDAAVQLMGRLATALYWFHPLAWYALHHLRVECEHACDDCVIRAGERPSEYAQQLLNLARSLRAPRLSSSVAMARTSTLEDRMLAMFDNDRSHAPLDRRLGRRLTALAVVLVLCLSTARLGQRALGNLEAPEPPSNSKPEPVADEPKDAAVPLAEVVAPMPRRVTGRVLLDSNGSPVAGADVSLYLPPRRAEDGSQGETILRTTKADAMGVFVFDDVAPHRYRVWANHGMLTSPRDTVQCAVVDATKGDEAPKPVELRLVQGVTVNVSVKNKADGKPIPNATIHLSWGVFPEDAKTNADGLALVQPLTPARWFLQVWADGFAIDSRWLNLENGSDAAAEFPLGPGGDLEGVVRDPSGKPLGGVGLNYSEDGAFQNMIYVETELDGRYRLRSLPRDLDLRIGLSKKDYGRKTIQAKVVSLKQSLDVAFEPRPFGGSIQGRVVDSEGRPIAGARLRNMGNSSNEVRETTTGPDGRFLLENLYEGSPLGKQVLVRAKGCSPKRVTVETGSADDPKETTISLSPGHRINGRVVDHRNRPIEGVRVAFAGGEYMDGDGDSGLTDKDGRFTFDALPADCPFTFRKSGFSDISERKLPLDGDGVVDIQMSPTGVLVGRVLDAKTNQPVRAFNVRVTFSPQRRPEDPRAGLRGDFISPGQTYQASDGRFKLDDLPLGLPLQVMVAADGYKQGVVERIVVALPSEAKTEEIRLQTLDASMIRTYQGRIQDGQGKPLAGVQVRLTAWRTRPNENPFLYFLLLWQDIQNGQIAQKVNVERFLQGATDDDGRFQFADVPREDKVDLYWWGAGVASGRVEQLEKNAETEPLVITAPAPARLIVTVDRGKHAQVGSVSIRPVELQGPNVDAKESSEAPRRFEASDLAPGKYDVQLMGPYEPLPGGQGAFTAKTLANKSVTLNAGETRHIEFK